MQESLAVTVKIMLQDVCAICGTPGAIPIQTLMLLAGHHAMRPVGTAAMDVVRLNVGVTSLLMQQVHAALRTPMVGKSHLALMQIKLNPTSL